MSLVVGLPNNSYKPTTDTEWVRTRLCKLQKGCTRLAAANDKVYQLLAHGRWFSPGTPVSSTTKTGRHDIAQIWLKVALNTKKLNQIINHLQDSIHYTVKSSVIHLFLEFYILPETSLILLYMFTQNSKRKLYIEICLPVNSTLCRMQIRTNPQCTISTNNYEENVNHVLLECEAYTRLVIGRSRTVGSAKKFVRITSGFGGG
jgi:hypothetical protein